MSAVIDSFWLSGTWSSDTIAPTLTVGIPSAAKMSRVPGKDSIDIPWSVNEDFQAYKVKIVPADNSIHTEGTLIESGGAGTAGNIYTATITDDEFVAAGATGAHIVKLFVQDAAGNWST